jgi:hypothetical protein
LPTDFSSPFSATSAARFFSASSSADRASRIFTSSVEISFFTTSSRPTSTSFPAAQSLRSFERICCVSIHLPMTSRVSSSDRPAGASWSSGPRELAGRTSTAPSATAIGYRGLMSWSSWVHNETLIVKPSEYSIPFV